MDEELPKEACDNFRAGYASNDKLSRGRKPQRKSHLRPYPSVLFCYVSYYCS